MKKLLVLTLLLAMSMTFVACNEEKEIQEVEIENEEVVEDKNINENEKTFDEILNEIRTVEIGTAGSSLKILGKTCDILNWVYTAQVTDEEIEEKTEKYLSALGDEEKTEFAEQYKFVYDTYKLMMNKENDSILEDAGLNNDSFLFDRDEIDSFEILEILNNIIK